MSLWKRVWASITRRKSKSLLLFLVIFILGNVIAGAIAIDESVNQTEKTIKSKLGAEATFELDYPTLWADQKENPEVFDALKDVPLETIQKIGKSEYVSYYDYNLVMYFESEKLKEYDTDKREKSEEESTLPSSIYLKGVHFGELLDTKEKRIELIEGRTLTTEEVEQGKKVVVVSKEWAETNHFSLGDKIILDNIIYDYTENGEQSTEPIVTQELAVEIVGLFSPVIVEHKEPDVKSDLDYSRDYRDYLIFNTMYLPNKVTSDLTLNYFQQWAKARPDIFTDENDIKRESKIFSPTYVLKSAEMAEDFKTDNQRLLPEYYEILTANDQYQAIAGSLNSMKKMANSILLVAISAAIFILTLVILLFLRDRKHEMGIYLSMGETHRKIITQITMEVLLLAAAAISLSVITGNFLASELSETLVTLNTPKVVTSMESFTPEFIATSRVSETDINSSFKVNLTIDYILIFYIVGLGTSILATLLPVMYLLRLNPKKILM